MKGSLRSHNTAARRNKRVVDGRHPEAELAQIAERHLKSAAP